jgi:lysyl-tRNA synthetase class 2
MMEELRMDRNDLSEQHAKPPKLHHSNRLQLRSDVLRAVRAFFFEHDYIEVDTPVRVPTPALEDFIDAEPSGDQWLRTSPELDMKRLLAGGHRRIFQIGPCFRSGEYGRRHRPEFTMLEWYCVDADYRDILRETHALVRTVATAINAGPALTYQTRTIDLDSCEVRTVAETFAEFAKDKGGDFDTVLVEQVEPNLGWAKPYFMIDYPVELGALARTKVDDPTVAERWELYIAGLELANAYSELTDADEQRRRFEECAGKRRARGQQVYPIDEAFLAALSNMPPSAGCALGIDRLLMLFADTIDIADVLV